MVYSSKDFNFVDFCRDSAKYASIMAFAAPKVESLRFLYQAEGLPKNISIEELTSPFGRRAKPSAQRIFREFFKAEIKRGQSKLVYYAEHEQTRIIFKAIMQGRTDYENMLPMTIGIKK